MLIQIRKHIWLKGVSTSNVGSNTEKQTTEIQDIYYHCRRPIRWSALQRKWFHIGNLTSFCTGMASCKTEAIDVQ